MATSIHKNELLHFNGAKEKEWLETNGLGGWSSSTVTGAHTRRYHGLLVAAIRPPTERMVLLSKLDETIVINDQRLELGSNCYPGIVHPRGYKYLERFDRGVFPEWYYEAEGVVLKKTIGMIHDENTVVIHYEVLEAEFPFVLELLPLVAARGYHQLRREGPALHWHADFRDGVFHNSPDGVNDLYISIPGSSFSYSPQWFRDFQYDLEQYRGLDHTEDLLNHGRFSVPLGMSDKLSIIVSTENPAGRDGSTLLKEEAERRLRMLGRVPGGDLTKLLTLAADQFIVKRNILDANTLGGTFETSNCDAATVIAGYHWFTDWGRDTMISLPGLCLCTGRADDAKKILAAFAASVSRGMLPNRFQDNGDEPEYNNVDGTLWYFLAVYKYLQFTNDLDFVLKELLPVMKDIIDCHFKGTRYNIKVDADGLLYAGEPGQQLTWMDARIGEWVVTPRMGKPVEIQALWFNALKIFAVLLRLNDQPGDAGLVELSAKKAMDSFISLFWFEEGSYLFDVVDEHGHQDATLRPNQLLAISLPFALIEGGRALSVLTIISEKLYTPVGLRTLPAEDTRYVPVYGGDAWHRDSAYHQGTVWSWLLGPYVDALVRVKKERTEAKAVIDNFSFHLREGCIGSVSEIFDAEYPHHPRGCVAQAWGVAELLRVIREHELAGI